ncbi:uncharacterized protein [Apostichopus japonicus]|uniref:uncharacterized protein n=1 Tax=Stichopus japonicus TaxID=307972 RepID=UPI003AB4A02E
MDGENDLSPAGGRFSLYSGRKKWSVLLWIILKILWLPHPNPVEANRKCLKCRLRAGFSPRQQFTLPTGGRANNSSRHPEPPTHSEDETQPLLGSQEENVKCDVCDTLWWNYYGETVKYNDIDIGAKPWCHYGSGVMSSVMLSILLAVNICFMGMVLYKTWAVSRRIIYLLNQTSLIGLLSSYPGIAFCSKLDYYLQGKCHYLLWSRTLHIRYLVTRGQYVDWKHTGLPGKPFLALCILWPGLTFLYLCYVLIELEKCLSSSTVNTLIHCVYCYVMMATWGLFMYLIYFIRVSFHRQFRHLLLYLNEFQGEIDLCRDTIQNVYAEFNCFRKCCNIYVMILFPLLILGITTMVTWNYVTGDDAQGMNHQRNINEILMNCLGWNTIVMGLSLSLIAIGGFNLKGLDDEFYFNVLQLQSECYAEFWKEIIYQITIASKASNHGVLITLSFAVIGSYMALHVQEQDLTHIC